MTLYPEAQKRAQEEISRVIGHNRLPKTSDRQILPYTDALVKEVYRFGQIGPQGVPHRARSDDVFEEFLIPKGSIVIANIWWTSIRFLAFDVTHDLVGIWQETPVYIRTPAYSSHHDFLVMSLNRIRARTFSALVAGEQWFRQSHSVSDSSRPAAESARVRPSPIRASGWLLRTSSRPWI